jgi:cell division transport system permease protein
MSHIHDQLAAFPGVTDINYSWRWLEKVEMIKSVTIQVGFALGLLIMLTVLLSSTHSIRLMARSRAVGFRQMLLLGTGRMFIAWPFLIEGFLLSGLAAMIGWGVILYYIDSINIQQFELVLPELNPIWYYCLSCALLGLLSGWLGIRTELKER